jgi:hypothetical protein
MLPSSLEWQLFAALIALSALAWAPALLIAALMLLLSLTVAGLQAGQARLAPRYEGWRSRALVFVLCYLQPLVRSWARYRTRFLAYHPPTSAPGEQARAGQRLPLRGTKSVAYWAANGHGRTQFLDRVIGYLDEHRWGKVLDSGWSDWDLEIYCHPWTVVLARTAEEDHGGGKRLIRVRYRLRPAGYTKLLGLGAAVAGVAAVVLQLWPLAVVAGTLAALGLAAWWRGAHRAGQAMGLFDSAAGAMEMVPCPPAAKEE